MKKRLGVYDDHTFVIGMIVMHRIRGFAIQASKILTRTSKFITRKMLLTQASLVFAVRARM